MVEIALFYSEEPNDMSQVELNWEGLSEHVTSQVSVCKRISAIVHSMVVEGLLQAQNSMSRMDSKDLPNEPNEPPTAEATSPRSGGTPASVIRSMTTELKATIGDRSMSKMFRMLGQER